MVIDKSEFRLYWVRDGMLVKTYPIAHGRKAGWTPSRTWRIDAKYHTAPGSVYGPRKMRLFKQVRTAAGYRYVRTAYGVHGTNQPWVIGTMASHGCIRMYNRDVLELFPQVPMGTMVVTRD
ncbi:MAG: L,D-transpeptidase [Actinobacteria bacterium]|nr:MAG: L,D-transpeptidase [Actinomycetota bacterium]